VKDIQSFIRFVNYYRKFIKDFSKIIEPMQRLVRKDIPFQWEKEQEESFQLTKEKMTTAPVRAMGD
jgi:hypothetical protein